MVGIKTASHPLLTRYLVAETDFFRADPLVFVDLGSRGGVNAEWQAFGDCVKIFGFEPDEDECARLNAKARPGITYLPWAIGARAGRASFYEAKLPASSGLYRTNMAYFGRLLNRDNGVTLSERQIALRTLEGALSNEGLASIDFIKLDVEGAELDILRGSESYLRGVNLLGLLSETRFQAEINGSPTFAALDTFLQPWGLRLYGLDFSQQSRAALPYPGSATYRLATGEGFFAYTTQGQIQDGNALYFRDLLIPENRPALQQYSPTRLLKLAALFELYSLNDCAAELIEATRARLEDAVDTNHLLDLLASGITGEPTSYQDYLTRYFAPPVEPDPDTIKVSVITPTIDSSIYLDEAVASVAAQNYPAIEHIIVHDGSDAFAAALAERHPHLKILRGPAAGPTGAGAAGIAAATGAFVLWLNSDDWLLPGAFHRLAECAKQRPNVDIWTGDCRIVRVDTGGKREPVRVIAGRDMTALTLANVLDDVPLLNARFCSRAAFARIGPINTDYPESSDREWLLRAVLAGVEEAELGMFVSEFRMHEGSRTIHGRKNAVPPFMWEHIRLAESWLTPRAPIPARGMLRRWRAREIFRLIVFLCRARRYRGALGTAAREMIMHPAWPFRALSAIAASRRRNRTASGAAAR